ncbi:hypothetical protein ACJX0J_041392, partial [Zea mays]
FKDAGGFEALVSGKTTEMQRIDVNERIVGLERLNPTPRPTTSPFLEGRWNFEWFGDSSPGAFAARLLFERSPTSVAHFMGLDVLIKDGYSKLSSNLKFLNTIQSKFLLTTQLSVEGPIRMKEEYVEGLIAIPRINEESLPEQLKGLLGQTAGALQQLPSPIREAVSEGLKLPLGGAFQRLFMISYLDEEILIVRDAAGAPDKLARLIKKNTLGIYFLVENNILQQMCSGHYKCLSLFFSASSTYIYPDIFRICQDRELLTNRVGIDIYVKIGHYILTIMFFYKIVLLTIENAISFLLYFYSIIFYFK